MKPIAGIDRNPILTHGQAAFLTAFARTELAHTFRFTGGTALSAFYLSHRLSDVENKFRGLTKKMIENELHG